MRNPSSNLLVTFCLALALSNITNVVSGIAVFNLGKQVVSGINKTWGLVEDFSKLDLILQNMYHISRKIEDTEHQIVLESSLANLLKQFGNSSKLEPTLQELAEHMHWISGQERIMRSFADSEQQPERHELESFADSIVAQDANSVQERLSRMELLVLGSQDLPLRKLGSLELMLQAMRFWSTSGLKNVISLISVVILRSRCLSRSGFKKTSEATICNLELSVQQVLYELFNAIAIANLRGYSMMQYSWMLLKAYGKGNFITETRLMRQRFEDRTSQAQQFLQQIMKQASGEYWRCDPERNQHKEGETFVQITRLLQGYVENEVNLNRNDTCRKDCAYYSSDVKQAQCKKGMYCTKQLVCSGKIYDCEFIDSHMWICPAANNSNRRYEYIEYENGMVFGQKKTCSRGTTKVESWWRWIFWHCSNCFCLCDDAKHSDRYINMRESVSDLKNNKVVTGMRFVKKNRIIHLIVQQGRLLPRGQIDNGTLEWAEPHNYNLLSANVHNGRDYHTLNRNNRSLDLDDLYVPQGYVVTGVRFRLLDNHLNLEIRKTQMNFATGQLVDPDKSTWIGNDNTERSVDTRTECELDRPHVPLLSLVKSLPDSASNQFIQFRASDRNMDAAQTTVPFFDAQPVAPVRPVPLSGAGLFHKGRSGFGGFVAPKVMTYDFGPHILAP